jgi:tripartite-type tricarboxylate transporter receptor subunit TctC
LKKQGIVTSKGMSRRDVASAFFACIATASLALPVAASAAYPDKPIRMIVPYPAGGGADNAGRVIARQMTLSMGQSVIVENRVGAGGLIAEQFVANAHPDGYTVLFDAVSITVNPFLHKEASERVQELIPVSLAATAAQVMVVSISSPYKTLADLVDAARNAPGTLTYGSPGTGSASYLAAEMMNDKFGMRVNHIPYKGGGPAMVDVMGDRVTMYIGNIASVKGNVTSGKLRALAVTTPKRVPSLPDVPTVAESGIPGYVVLEWNGLFAPKGTSPDVVSRLAKGIQVAVKDPETRNLLVQFGLEPIGSTPAEFAAFRKNDSDRWGALLKAHNVQPE